MQDFYCINFINNNSRGELEENGSGCDVETWISQIFQIVGVLTGLFGMYITDRYGIRVSVFFYFFKIFYFSVSFGSCSKFVWRNYSFYLLVAIARKIRSITFPLFWTNNISNESTIFSLPFA